MITWAQRKKGGMLKTVRSFEVFYCKRKERNKAAVRGACEIKQNFV